MHQRSPAINSPSPIQLLIVDSDPVFRLGLRLWLEQYPDLQIIAEAAHATAVLEILAQALPTLAAGSHPSVGGESYNSMPLLILDLELGDSGAREGQQLCQQLRRQYPTLPILLLTTQRQIPTLASLWQLGVNGYCPKGIEVAELVRVIRQVAAGEGGWDPKLQAMLQTYLSSRASYASGAVSGPLATLRQRLWAASQQEMAATLTQLETQLQFPTLTWWQRAVLEGQHREVRAARWLVKRLLVPPVTVQVPVKTTAARSFPPPPVPTLTATATTSTGSLVPSSLGVGDGEMQYGEMQYGEMQFRTLKTLLWETIVAKLANGLVNQTGEPLEIDILKPEKKRELFHTVLRKLEDLLDELRFSQVRPSQLPEKRSQILLDLWRVATADFFGRYTTLTIPSAAQSFRTEVTEVEIVGVLLQEQATVQTEILEKIPLVVELLEHLLFLMPLQVDNAAYPPGSAAAVNQATALLENLLLQVANAVVQPLLNRFADMEIIKQTFYDRRLISTREIERFRNALSWKYRLRRLLREPQEIFESRYQLLTVSDYSLKTTAIYAPRRQELQQLSGWPLVVTLALETRDAIAPPLRSTVKFLGQGIIYFLTQVVGRSIGLIGRGILQGIGSSWQEIRYNRKNSQQK